MTSTTFINGTVIQPDWLNDVNTSVYGTVSNVKSLAYGAKGDGTTDDLPAFIAAIADFSVFGGTLYVPAGTYKFVGSLSINKPIMVIGQGEGQVTFATQQAATRLLFAGTAGNAVIKFGAFSSANMIGGGLQRLCIDGNGTAGRCLSIKDSQKAFFKNLDIVGPTLDGIIMQNSIGSITGFSRFEDIYIELRARAESINANGINLNGTNTGGSDGVTLCTMDRVRVDHANGYGVYVQQIGDAFTWNTLQTFRIDSDTGSGVVFGANNATPAICGYHVFINPIVSGGFRFDTAGFHGGTRIINDGQGDINAGGARVYGPGAGEVAYIGGYGFPLGGGLIPDIHRTTVRDNMSLIRFDTVNNLINTANGNWKTALVGSGSIADAGQSGSAIRLATGTSNNDSVSFFDAATISGGSGWNFNHGVLNTTILSPITITNVVLRFGFYNSTGDTPTNGAYWEFDPSVDSHWQVVTKAGGTETRTTTALSGFSGLQELTIYIAQAGAHAAFLYRTDGNTSYGVGATHTTNIPVIGIPYCARIKTKTTALANVDIYGIKIGSTDEAVGAF